MLDKIVRIVFTILFAGMLLGTQATMTTSVKPVLVETGEGTVDIKVSKSNSDTLYDTLEMTGKCLTPISYENDKWYYSKTLDIADITEVTESQIKDYILSGSYTFSTETKDVNYVRLELELDGNDELNKALRVMVSGPQIGTKILSMENPVLDTSAKISKLYSQSVNIYIWYELADESCTIENINNANGVNIKIKVGAYYKDA